MLDDSETESLSYVIDNIPEGKRDLLRDAMASSFAHDLHLNSTEWDYVTNYISRHHEQMRAPNPDQPDSHGLSRATSYGGTYDTDDSIFDALFTQYIKSEDREPPEVWLYAAPDTKSAEQANKNFTVEIEKLKLVDLKTVPVEQHTAMLAAIAKEFNGLISIGTFADIECPWDRKPIPSRIVLKAKYRANGEFDKLKARHVVKGFMQQLGFDYFSTFSPMATMTAVRVLFAIAVHEDLEIWHADVPQAFLKALLNEDIWARLPPGVKFIDSSTGKAHTVVKLIRALYGLKQSPQMFNKELLRFLKQKGLDFKQITADSCLYYHVNETTGKFVIIASEVDDLLITGNDLEHIATLKKTLHEQYDVTSYEKLSSFLGINIEHSPGTLTMDVRAKIVDLFNRHAVLVKLQSNKADVPINDAVMDVPDNAKEGFSAIDKYIEDNYASINGSIIYMAITCRPDITFTIGKTSRGMHAPKPRHIAMMKQLLAYLWKTRDYKLHYYRDGTNVRSHFRDIQDNDKGVAFFCGSDGQNIDPALAGMADANFANLKDEERKSISGFCLFVFFCLISWRSKIQTITAESTHEAELIAVALAANEMVWIRKLLLELGFALGKAAVARPKLEADKPETREHHLPEDTFGDDENNDEAHGKYSLPPSVLANDNKGTTQTFNNPETNMRNRFLDVKYFKVRDYIRWNRLAVCYVPSEKNIADFFTKGLIYGPFNKHRTYLGVTL